MISALNKQPDGTIELTITIPAGDVKKAWEEVVGETVKNTTLPGFRKGKAPKKLVEKKIDKEKVKEEVLQKLLPESYVEAVKVHNLKPIINPKIHVKKLGEGEDWQFTALTCEAPQVELDNYKDRIASVTAKEKIVVPGENPQPAKFEEIVKVLLEAITVKIPTIVIEGEVDRLLSQTLDEVKRLGLSLDQYLSSTGRTPHSLRAEYEKRAENDIKLEFALQKIAQVEKITVDDKEIEGAINKAKDDEERKNLQANRYMLASILRQQKTLDFIRNL